MAADAIEGASKLLQWSQDMNNEVPVDTFCAQLSSDH